MAELKLIEMEGGIGVVLPENVLTRLGVSLGDSLYAIETQEGLRLIPSDPEFVLQMDIARRIMHEKRDILRRLAE